MSLPLLPIVFASVSQAVVELTHCTLTADDPLLPTKTSTCNAFKILQPQPLRIAGVPMYNAADTVGTIAALHDYYGSNYKKYKRKCLTCKSKEHCMW